MSRAYRLGPLALADHGGVRYRKRKLTGWDGTSGSSLTLTQKTAGPGAWRGGTPQWTPRVLVLSAMIEARSEADMAAEVEAINDACSLENTTLQVDDAAGSRWMLVSIQDVPAWTPYPTSLVKEFSLQLVADDPRKFADAISDSTGLPKATGGLTVPFTVPFTINETVISGAVSLDQRGNADTAPTVVRFDGPSGPPIVTHQQTGRRVAFRPGFSLGVGEFVTVDMESGAVLAQGQGVSRAGSLLEHGFQPAIRGVNTWLFTTTGTYESRARMGVYLWPSWK